MRSGPSRGSVGAVTAWALMLAAVAGCRTHVPLAELEPSTIETTLFLIGDAGEPNPRDIGVALKALTEQAAVAPERSIVVFLGDNVYPAGIPEEGQAEYADARRRLEAQVRAVPPGAQGIFLPGNHDWANAGPFGLYSIRLQERIIASLARRPEVRMLPGNGCPGPVPIDVGRLRFISLDTQWWLHSFIVRDSVSNCETGVGQVTANLRQQVQAEGEGRVVIVAGHHPLMTGGEHGGYCGVTGPFRRFGGRSQDIISSGNRTMRDSLHSAFSARPPLLYAAGHDHNLHVLRGGKSARFLVVSGAGSQAKTACAVKMRESYYVSQHRSGFMRVDIMKDRGVLLRVYRYTGGGVGGLSYSHWLELR